ncbi:MAG: hypothetical protein WCA35_31400 [Kovacikia sp.]
MQAEVKATQDNLLFTELSEEESSEVNGGHWHHRGYYRRHYGYGYGYYRPVSYYRPYYRPVAYYYGGCGY